MKNLIRLTLSHSFVGVVGFAAGIYMLPIMTAPTAPDIQTVEKVAASSLYQTEFERDLNGSDFLHWGEGSVSLGKAYISFNGELSPGPDFKLYLSPVFVETEADFIRHKADMVTVGDVNTFDNFIVPVGKHINLSEYNSVIVWCESFGEFITAAKYR